MADEINISREEKLAAARKKLKEYQRRREEGATTEGSVSSNVSEKSDVEGSISEAGESKEKQLVSFANNNNENGHDLQTLQILIAEKTQLLHDVNKLSAQLREKSLELEEIRTQFNGTTQRINELQEQFVLQQQNTEQLRRQNAELQHKLAQSRAENEDQSTLIQELQKEIVRNQEYMNEQIRELKTTRDKLEMAEIRIQQLSDESSLGTDNRVETMMQTQLMHEQQIRDLQAMVQQLTEEKEQSNVQYQNYVQQLNIEVAKLNERNAALQQESEHYQQREQQLVEHVGGLEREIQKNLNRQQKLKTEHENTEKVETNNDEVQKLQEKICELEFERHEFILKVKSQEDRLQLLEAQLQQSQDELESIQSRFQAIASTQPEQTKMLALIESDRVATSRALSQNREMKKQLDELESGFIQLTNDKADLCNQLDAERFNNRTMKQNYQAMEERLQNIDERFKFKDEEMIRLTHENTKLSNQVALLQKQLKKQKPINKRKINESQIEEHSTNVHDVHDHHNNEHHEHENDHDHDHDHHEHEHDHDHHNHDHDHGHHVHDHDHHGHENDHDHDHHEHDHEHSHDHDHDHDHEHPAHDYENHDYEEDNDLDECIEVSETTELNNIYTREAMEKLQKRFTKLISQVADLTDEKQRLEHLVLQLQGETETIGEYVTLYQTQRRMLKQREYEKASQMQLLKSEREQLREKIQFLNHLVSSLNIKLPENSTVTNDEAQNHNELTVPNQHSQQQGQELTDVLSGKTNDSQLILDKIHHIITEIEQNTKEPVVEDDAIQHTADQLKCCSGKFEVV